MISEPFDDPRLTVMGLVVEVHDGLAAKLDSVLRPRGLSGNDFDTLIRLARSPGRRLRMTDLANQTSLSTSGVTRVVDRMESEGLVRREASPTDRRTWFAVLTDAGAQRLSTVLPDVLATIERWLTGPLTPAQLEALSEALRVVRAAVRPDAAAGADA